MYKKMTKDELKKQLKALREVLDKLDKNESRKEYKGIFLSIADIDSARLYAEAIEQHGHYKMYMPPRNEVEEILREFKLVDEDEESMWGLC